MKISLTFDHYFDHLFFVLGGKFMSQCVWGTT